MSVREDQAHREELERQCAYNLRQYAIRGSMNKEQVKEILHIIRPICSFLPKSYATFINTKSIEDFEIQNSDDDAKFVYFGLKFHLRNTINPDLHSDRQLKLQVNFDGLPLFKFSSFEFRPTLGHIFYKNLYDPFVIALHFGKGKPKDLNQFLANFIQELNDILKNGLEIGGKLFNIKFTGFVCDIPARCYLQNIKGHNEFYSCKRCNIPGFSLEGVTFFPFLHYERRTNKSFRLQTRKEHHKGKTPLVELYEDVDLVKDFILDSMHLIYLGVMKRLLTHYWLKPGKFKLPTHKSDKLLLRLKNLSSQIPTEFQGNTKSFDNISKWKATHLRFCTLYAGPFIFKDILPYQQYRHFMLLHAGIRILNSKKLFLDRAKLAQFYLERFFIAACHIYGYSAQVMNTHLLCHLVDDVRRFGRTLDDLSAFRFENTLGKIKNSLNSGFKPMEQFKRSLREKQLLEDKKPKLPTNFEIISCNMKDNYNVIKINKLKYRQLIFTPNLPNSLAVLKNGQIVRITQFSTLSEDAEIDAINVRGNFLELEGSAYSYPTDSSLFQIYKVKIELEESVNFRLIDILNKMVLLNVFENESDKEKLENCFVIPFLHTV